MKRQLLFLMLMLASFTAFAHDFEVNGIYFNIFVDGSCEVTSGSKRYTGSVVIPSEVSYEGKVYNVKNIGRRAFYNCYDLKNVTIPNSVKSIGQEAFYGSGIITVNIPNGVTTIEQRTFYQCDALTHVTIPESVTSIGMQAFQGCSNLSSVRCFAKESPICSSGPFASFSINSRNPVTLIVDESAVTAYSAATVWKDFSNIKPIAKEPMTGKCGNNATYTYDMKSGLLTISGKGEINTDDNAWRTVNYNIANEVLDFVIEDGLTTGYLSSFGFKALNSVVIPASVEHLYSSFLAADYIGTLTLPSTLTNTEIRACRSFSSSSIFIDKIVVACKDESDFCDYVQRSDIDETFCSTYSKMTGLQSETRAISIGGKEMTDIIIPEGVTRIGISAFYQNTTLKSISIPASVTSIGDYAFQKSSNLTSITSYAIVPPTCGTESFFGVPTSKAVLKVPASAVEAYKSADQWKNFTIEAISDDEDAIECIHGVSKTEKIYTLSGMPINRADMKRGNVYIIKTDGRSKKYLF